MKTLKVGRNDPCPCGSGLKHKKCCLGNSETGIEDFEATYVRKYNIRLKKADDIDGIRKAGRLVLDTLDLVESKSSSYLAKVIDQPGEPSDRVCDFSKATVALLTNK